MNAWLPQASYPCGNFSDTSNVNFSLVKGSLGHTFMVRIHTENPNQASFCPYALREISVLTELTLGHLCYLLTDVPPQPNSPPDTVFRQCHTNSPNGLVSIYFEKNYTFYSAVSTHNRISETTSKVVVFHWRRSSHLCYTDRVISQCQTRVKLNRVFFPRYFVSQARSLGCGFTRRQVGTVGISLIHSCASLIR